jgi:hypothetical protein
MVVQQRGVLFKEFSEIAPKLMSITGLKLNIGELYGGLGDLHEKFK